MTSTSATREIDHIQAPSFQLLILLAAPSPAAVGRPVPELVVGLPTTLAGWSAPATTALLAGFPPDVTDTYWKQ